MTDKILDKLRESIESKFISSVADKKGAAAFWKKYPVDTNYLKSIGYSEQQILNIAQARFKAYGCGSVNDWVLGREIRIFPGEHGISEEKFAMVQKGIEVTLEDLHLRFGVSGRPKDERWISYVNKFNDGEYVDDGVSTEIANELHKEGGQKYAFVILLGDLKYESDKPSRISARVDVVLGSCIVESKHYLLKLLARHEVLHFFDMVYPVHHEDDGGIVKGGKHHKSSEELGYDRADNMYCANYSDIGVADLGTKKASRPLCLRCYEHKIYALRKVRDNYSLDDLFTISDNVIDNIIKRRQKEERKLPEEKPKQDPILEKLRSPGNTYKKR